MTSGKLMLTHRVTTTPSASGSGFYVEAGREFDLDAYASAHALDASEFPDGEIDAACTAARNLKQGEWLFVTHETTGSK